MTQRRYAAASYRMRLVIDEFQARRLSDALADYFGAEAAVAAFEIEDGRWCVEADFTLAPDRKVLTALASRIAGQKTASALTYSRIVEKDWIAVSLAGLKPVVAGRFTVHGAHDRARLGINRLGIEIEAGLAFGTGHHGTTRGCLLALDALAKRQKKNPKCAREPKTLLHLSPLGRGRPPKQSRARRRRAGEGRLPIESLNPPHPDPLPTGERGKSDRRVGILDLGAGTGVLAIAAAKIFRTRIIASDIDPLAAAVARQNARQNHAGSMIEVLHAAGLASPRLRARAPFDLVFANILLGPLKLLAAPMARVLAPNGRIVLSGLLAAQEKAALAAYRAQGFSLERRILLDGWVTLVLTRRTAVPR